jgi:hypothetical protein
MYVQYVKFNDKKVRGTFEMLINNGIRTDASNVGLSANMNMYKNSGIQSWIGFDTKTEGTSQMYTYTEGKERREKRETKMGM